VIREAGGEHIGPVFRSRESANSVDRSRSSDGTYSIAKALQREESAMPDAASFEQFWDLLAKLFRQLIQD
jgi:hypothetical protein